MNIRSLRTRFGGLRVVWIQLVLLCIATVGLASCATSPSEQASSRARNGLAEFREMVAFAMTSMEKTMGSLDQLTIHTNRKSFEAFANNVNRLDVDSIQVRARAKAMEARGDAYFEEWRLRLAQMDDGSARKLGEERREELKQSFDQIFQTARQTRQTFNSFLTGLHHIRARLEQDPGVENVNSARTLIASTQKSGYQVQAGLAEILAELNSISARVTSPGTADLKQP